MNKKTLFAVILAILVIVIVVGLVIFKKRPARQGALPLPSPSATPVTPDVGNEISKVKNPTEALPQTNPFGSATNPFKNTYKNPFSN